MNEANIYLTLLVIAAMAIVVLGGIVWHQSNDLERITDQRDALRARVAELDADTQSLREQLAYGATRERKLRERCKQYLDELDALSVAGRPDPREVFAASVEADLAGLPVAEPERPRRPKHATRLWPPFAGGHDPAKPPFGQAVYPRPDERREA